MPAQKELIIINYKFDYSQMTIGKWSAREYIIAHENNNNLSPDDVWNSFTQKVESTFLGIANGQLIKKGYQLNNEIEASYEMTIYLKDADSGGGHVIVGILYNKTNGNMISKIKSFGIGSRWNNFSDLLIESMEVSVPRFVKRLIRAIK